MLISEDFKDLLPRYMSFIKGVVDSDDLPLNVSRETLQQLRILKTIKKKLVKKVIARLKKYATADIEDDYYDEEEMEDMSEKEKEELKARVEKKKEEVLEKYVNFWKQFGKFIKMGIVEDVPNRETLAGIARFYSTFNNTDTLVSFEEYLSRVKENQKDIYYFGG